MPTKGAAVELDDPIESTESGAAKTIPIQCSALRKNQHCMIKGHPCKIVDMSTSKTGKHGHAKVHLVGLDIFDGKKHEDICPSTHNMEVPVMKTITYTLVDIDEDYLQLMDDNGEMKSDLKVPNDDGGDKIRSTFEKATDEGKDCLVTVVSAVGTEKPISAKLGTSSDK